MELSHVPKPIYISASKSPHPPPQQVTDPFICDYDWNIHDCLAISLLKSDIKPSVQWEC